MNVIADGLPQVQPSPQRPRPFVSERTAPFWDAARRGELVIQRCRDCGTFFHPPVPVCMRCHSLELGFAAVSGRGAVQSFSVMRGSPPPGFEQVTPYAVLAVELDEQPRLIVMANLVGAAPDGLRIGDRVRAVFEAEDDGFVYPMFELDPDGGRR